MYYSWKSVITKADCEKIVNDHKDKEYSQATIGKNGKSCSDLDTRNTLIQWVDPDSLLTRAVRSFMVEANNRYFIYNMAESEKVQFAKYEVGGKYEWHQDIPDASAKTYRKLSTMVQLSDPSSYDGGEFQFYNGENQPEDLDRKAQGSVIIFDSRDWHRLTPITKGVRYSLAQWSHGDRFV